MRSTIPMKPACGLLIALLAIGAGGAKAADSNSAGRTKAAVCAACHGLDGRSRMPEAPNLAGQVQGYLLEQLQAFKSGERHNEQMAIIVKPLSPRDMEDLAAYYASLDPSNAASAPP